jgi:hypothetical protein
MEGQKMPFGFMAVILLYYGHQHVSSGHLQGGENKNIKIIKMSLNYSTVQKS